MKRIIGMFLILSVFLFADETEIKKMMGKVVELKDGELIIEIEGKVEKLKIAPLWFIIENEYKIEVGKEVEVSYYINKEDKTVQQLTQNKVTMQFADDKGNSYWERQGVFRKKPEPIRKTDEKRKRIDPRKRDNRPRRR